MLDVLVADQLWSVARTIKMIPGVRLPARMTVIRLDAARIALHSPVPIDDALAAQLAALGTVSVIIAPNNYHHLYLPKTVLRYPHAEVWGAPGLPSKRPEVTFPHLLEATAAPSWGDVLSPYFLAGGPLMDETVFVHRATRTLIVTDSYFNLMSGAPGPLSPIVFRLMGTWKSGGQSRMWRSIVKDREAMATSTRAVLDQDFDRLVMAHGDVIETGGKSAYERASSWLFR